MKKIWDTLGTTFGIAVSIILTFLFFSGVLHAFKRHGNGEGALSIVFFPMGIYYGAETYWHDTDNIDWDKKLKTDFESMIYLINTGSSPKENQFQVNEDIEKFSNKISEYPQDKLEYLKGGARSYIHYSIYSYDDVMSWQERFIKKDTAFKFSSKTNSEVEKLSTLYKINGVKQISDSLISDYKRYIINESFGSDSEEIVHTFEKLRANQSVYIPAYENTFTKLFNEKL